MAKISTFQVYLIIKELEGTYGGLGLIDSQKATIDWISQLPF
jgi:hypothetical protein